MFTAPVEQIDGGYDEVDTHSPRTTRRHATRDYAWANKHLFKEDEKPTPHIPSPLPEVSYAKFLDNTPLICYQRQHHHHRDVEASGCTCCNRYYSDCESTLDFSEYGYEQDKGTDAYKEYVSSDEENEGQMFTRHSHARTPFPSCNCCGNCWSDCESVYEEEETISSEEEDNIHTEEYIISDGTTQKIFQLPIKQETPYTLPLTYEACILCINLCRKIDFDTKNLFIQLHKDTVITTVNEFLLQKSYPFSEGSSPMNFWIDRIDCPANRKEFNDIMEDCLTQRVGQSVAQEDNTIKEENTVFSDQRETVEDTGYLQGQVETSLSNMTMDEGEWHVRNVMSKPLPVQTFEWTVTDPRGKILKMYDVPSELIAGPHYNLFATFLYARMHPKIHIQVNGTKFHCGRLLVGFFPWFRESCNSENFAPAGNYTSFPHGIIDASVSNSVTLEIPFVSQYSYFTTQASNHSSYRRQTLGTLMFVNFNRLLAATATSTSVTVTVWVSWDNCELHQPCPAHRVSFGNRKSDKRSTEEQNEGQSSQKFVSTRKDEGVVVLSKNGKGATRLQETSMGENSFDLKTMLRRYSPVWKVYQESFKGIAMLQIPNSPTLSDAHQCFATNSRNIQCRTTLAHFAEMFAFWRGSLRYKLVFSVRDGGNAVLNCNVKVYHVPQQVTIPKGTPQERDTSTKMIGYLPLLQYGTLVAESRVQGSLEFEIPFYTPFTQLSTVTEVNIGNDDTSLCTTGTIFVVFEPCTEDKDGAVLSYTLFQAAGDDFVCNYLKCAPILNFYKDTEKYRNLSDQTANLYYGIMPAPGNCSISKNEGQAGIVEGAVASMLPSVVDMAQKASGNILSSVTGGASNCDKPTDPTELQRWVPNAVSSLNFGDGLDVCNRLSLIRQGATVTREDVIGTNTDDMNILDICKIPCRIIVKEWTTTNSAKQQLIDIPVRPNFVDNSNITDVSGTKPPITSYSASNLAYCARAYKYWTGSLRYKIQIVASMMHSGRLMVAFVPDEIDAASFALSSYYSTFIIDLQEKHEVEFIVPYMSCRPWMRCDKLYGGNTRALSETGNLKIFVLNRLVVPDNTPKSIDINVFVSAGDDFRMAVPCDLSYVNSITLPLVATPVTKPTSEKSENEGQMFSGFREASQMPQKINAACNAITSVASKVENIAAGAFQTAAEEESSGEDDDEPPEQVFNFATEIKRLKNNYKSWWSESTATFTGFFANFGRQVGDLAKDYARRKTGQDVVDCLQRITSIINDIYIFTRDSPFLMKINAIVNFVLTITQGLVSHAKSQIFEFVQGVLEKVCPPREGQAGGPEVLAIAPGLMAALAATASILVCGKLPKDKDNINFQNFLTSRLKLYSAAVMGATSVFILFNRFSDLFKSTMDWFLEKFQPNIFHQLKMQQDLEKIDEWRKFVEGLDLICVEDSMNFDTTFRDEFVRWMDFTNTLTTRLVHGSFGREANVIRDYIKRMREAWKAADKCTAHLPVRVDPFSVQFFGPAGVGKSSIVTEIGYRVNDALEIPLFNRWCAINPADKFFSENYRGQTNVYIDDMFAMTTEEQFATFLNCKANTAYPLNMAFSKGMHFTSKFIWSTTNTPYPQPTCMTHIPALWRRRNMLIEVAYANDETQERALRQEFVIQDDKSHIRFRLRNPNMEGLEHAGTWMSYQEMYEIIERESRMYLARQETFVRRNLDMMGYGQGQAKQEPALNTGLMKKDVKLAEIDHDLMDALYVEEGRIRARVQNLNDFNEDWVETKRYYEENHYQVFGKLSLEQYIISKYFVTPVKTWRRSFTDFVTGMKEKMHEIYKTDWMKIMRKIYDYLPYIVAGAAATFGVLQLSKMLFHKCICATLRTFSFRCGLCGKWPDKTSAFILSEWKKLFPNSPYKPGYVLTPESEALLKSMQAQLTPEELAKIHVNKSDEKAEAGTEESALGQGKIYSSGDTTVSTPVFRKIAQAGGRGTLQLAEARVVPYIYPIRKWIGNSWYSANAFAVGGRNVIMPRHWTKGGLDEAEMFHGGVWMPFNFSELCIVKDLPEKDLVIYSMPARFHQHKDQAHLFVSEEVLHTMPKPQVMLFTKGYENPNSSVYFAGAKARPIETLDYVNTMPTGERQIQITQRAWEYDYPTQGGHCGGVLVCANDAQVCFLGIHISGNTRAGKGQAVIVTREMLEEWLPNGCTSQGLALPPVLLEEKPGFVPKGHFSIAGKMPTHLQRRPPCKTQIIPTPIHDMVMKHTSEPAPLHSGDPRMKVRMDPLRRGIEKYGKVAPQFDSELVNLATMYMIQEVQNWEKPREPKPLLVEEAICGIPSLAAEGYEKIDLTTSPGWPYVCDNNREGKGKRSYFGHEEKNGVLVPDGTIKSKDLKRRLTQRIANAYTGNRVESVWMDCLKDETRSLEKVADGKTRVFTIGPQDFTLFARMFTLDFSCAMKKNRIKSFPLVGIDPHSMEWTELYNRLSEFSPYVIAGDFTSFDGTIPAELIKQMPLIFMAYYKNPDLNNVFEVLFEELAHTVTLARDTCYVSHGGNPSGCPITVVINCIINMMYMIMAYLTLARKHSPDDATIFGFRKNVRAVVYGDDNILAIKPEILDWYNQESISEVLSGYGIGYTDEGKKGITKFKTLDESSILKRTFANITEYPLIKVPQIDKKTIYEMLNWIHICPDEEEQLRVSANEALRYAFFYGREFFEELRDKIIEAMHEKDIYVILDLWSDYDYWFSRICGMK